MASVPVRGPVDTENITLIAGGPGGPQVRDRRTGEVATDAQGNTVYVISLSVFIPGEDVPQVWKVKLAKEPKEVRQGIPVKVTGLVFSEWSMRDGDRLSHGVSFRAESVEPLAASTRRAA